ncbi:MAG: membrane protein insertase YidC [Clostridia bacterium]|nr:membrane protein insertase YidC [Clostridia bacterium]
MDFIAKPFAWILQAFYSFTNNYAIALIFFTVIVKLLLLFFNVKQQKSAQGQARIKPKMTAIRLRYEGRKDPNVQAEYSNDLMALYKEEKVSASMGCLPLLIQLPFIAILYRIVTNPLTYLCEATEAAIAGIKSIIFSTPLEALKNVPNAVAKAITDANGDVSKFQISEMQMITVMKNNEGAFSEFLSSYSLPNFNIGALDLSQTPTLALNILVIVPLLVGLFQFLTSFVIQLFSPKQDKSSPEAAQAAKTMMYMNIIMPLFTVYLAFQMPAIIGVYWIYQSILGAIIHIILSKLIPIPTYTEEEVQSIIAEYNKDYVRPEIKNGGRRSLHYIDDEDYGEEDGADDCETETDGATSLPEMPERRRYDKNGNKIRSLHFIDEDDDSGESSDSASEQNSESASDEGKDL